MTEQISAMESTITGLHDGDFRLTRVLDSAARLYLRVGDPTPAGYDRTVGDLSASLSGVLSKLHHASSRIHCFVEIMWIDPATNVGFLQLQKTQTRLENHARRLQSSQSRYAP